MYVYYARNLIHILFPIPIHMHPHYATHPEQKKITINICFLNGARSALKTHKTIRIEAVVFVRIHEQKINTYKILHHIHSIYGIFMLNMCSQNCSRYRSGSAHSTPILRCMINAPSN